MFNINICSNVRPGVVSLKVIYDSSLVFDLLSRRALSDLIYGRTQKKTLNPELVFALSSHRCREALR